MKQSVREGDRAERGQALVLFTLMIVVLLGFAALAIDVSSAYATLRFERSVADAAALAGGQDLQATGQTNKQPSSAMQASARCHSLWSLWDQLGATGTAPDCTSAIYGSTAVTMTLPGTPYVVWVTTPSPSCSTCDPENSIQVTVRNPSFKTSFASLFGQRGWDLGITSVAGLGWPPQYAVITLQPSDTRRNGTDANLCQDLAVKGNNTVLNVVTGDVGTNTSAATTNAGRINVKAGMIYHVDDLSSATCGLFTNPTWYTDPTSGEPQGKPIPPWIPDPNYRYADFTGAPTYVDQTDTSAMIGCTDPSVDFPSDNATAAMLAGATCYRPGIYTSKFTVNNGTVAYLAPGAYWFQGGVDVKGTLGGGLVDGHPGVALVVPEATGAGSSVGFINSSSSAIIALNSGSLGCGLNSCRATAATDYANKLVETPEHLVLTVEVTRDKSCFIGTTPTIKNGCSPTDADQAVQMNAASAVNGGFVRVGGVIYGPSDNMKIAGGLPQYGLVGQIVAWTVTYSGGSTLEQAYPGGLGNGVLRIDSACSGPNTPCSAP